VTDEELIRRFDQLYESIRDRRTEIQHSEARTLETIRDSEARTLETMRDMQTEILRGLERFARGNFARMHRLEVSDNDLNERMNALEERITAQEYIRIRGARVHNLKNISLSLPHNQLTVITGVSGSGKSSLAFDTIYAEGQRRYVESLSAYARQFLERMEKPASRISTASRPPSPSARRTPAGIRAPRWPPPRNATTFCGCCSPAWAAPFAPTAARAWSATRWIRWPSGCWPCPPARAGTRCFPSARKPIPTRKALRDHLFDLRKKGFNRLFQAGRIFEFSTPESLLDIDFRSPSSCWSIASPSPPNRVPSCASAWSIPSKSAIAKPAKSCWSPPVGARGRPACLRFSEKFACKQCGLAFVEPEPRLFSFNNPFGACPRCQGFGNTIDFDMDLAIPDKTKTLEGGAVDPWTKPKHRSWLGNFRKTARSKGVRLTVPFCDLTEKEQETVFAAIRNFFEYLETKKYKLHVRVFLSRYRGYALCPECRGARLRKEALYIRVSEPQHLRCRAHEHRRSAGLLRCACIFRRKKPPSPRRSWSRSGSGSSS
jgi:excinuclease ABC subunit A